ncbi:hypothetical protein DFH07DRAFT_769285 [Mycena maculata]|uniref:Uncharacterized protein n=1 Tax=Mycena maculata TaxID=230809 RepID=A0AAD7NN33_9AGAR|nr:hypothetical protein DFH07DRAFT_769285 [Mycena maculata]
MPSGSSTKELLKRSKRRRLEHQNAPPSSTPSSPVFPPTPNLPLPPPFSLDSMSSPFTTPASTTTTLSICDTSLAQPKNFGEHELNASNKDERDALQALWTLEVQDRLSKLTQNTAESWIASSALKKAACHNIYSLLLLPNVHFYSGTLVEVLLLAMHTVNTPDLPKADSIHADELGTWLDKESSQACYAIKKTITENSGLNVADLAAELLSLAHANHVPSTLGLYICLALLRRHFALKHNPNSFWAKVDNELEALREGGSETYVEYFSLLKDIYDDDIQEFSDPSTTEHTVKSFTDPDFTCPRWLWELYAVAPQVKCLPKKKSKAKKRKQITTDDEEDNSHDNGPRNENNHSEGIAEGEQ